MHSGEAMSPSFRLHKKLIHCVGAFIHFFFNSVTPIAREMHRGQKVSCQYRCERAYVTLRHTAHHESTNRLAVLFHAPITDWASARVGANVVVTSARASSVHTIEKTLMNVSKIKIEDNFIPCPLQTNDTEK